MFPGNLRTQERMIEVKFGEELERQHKRGFNRYAGGSTRASHPVIDAVIAIIILLLAIAAFLLIYSIY
jgi:hypothetical protein